MGCLDIKLLKISHNGAMRYLIVLAPLILCSCSTGSWQNMGERFSNAAMAVGRTHMQTTGYSPRRAREIEAEIHNTNVACRRYNARNSAYYQLDCRNIGPDL